MKIKIFILLFLSSISIFSQSNKEAYKSGEWLKYRIHYGLINAGYATVNLKSTSKKNRDAYHVIGKGWTTGVTKIFFKVKDNYQTYFFKDTHEPYHFRRRVNEGGHIISRDVYFDHEKNTAIVKDHKKKTKKTIAIEGVQDMVSSFYYLRNQDINSLKTGKDIELKMFFDSKTNNFKMRYLGEDLLNTKFGKVKCYKFRPIVQSGRVFKAEESLTVWVTADDNKIPIRIKADLAVGSLKADLHEFKGLANPFNIIFDN